MKNVLQYIFASAVALVSTQTQASAGYYMNADALLGRALAKDIKRSHYEKQHLASRSWDNFSRRYLDSLRADWDPPGNKFQGAINNWSPEAFRNAGNLVEALNSLIRQTASSGDLSDDDAKEMSQALQLRLTLEKKSLMDITPEPKSNIFHYVATLGDKNLLKVLYRAAGKDLWKLLHTYDSDGRFPIHIVERKMVGANVESKWRSFEWMLRSLTGSCERPWYEDDFDSPEALRRRLLYKHFFRPSLKDSIALFKEALVEYNKDLFKIRDSEGRTILHELCHMSFLMDYIDFQFAVDMIAGALGQDLYKSLLEIQDNKGKKAVVNQCNFFDDGDDYCTY